MASVGGSLASSRNVALAMFVTLLVGVFLCLPTQVMAFLLGWIAVSIPVGVVVGHCVLSEQ